MKEAIYLLLVDNSTYFAVGETGRKLSMAAVGVDIVRIFHLDSLRVPPRSLPEASDKLAVRQVAETDQSFGRGGLACVSRCTRLPQAGTLRCLYWDGR